MPEMGRDDFLRVAWRDATKLYRTHLTGGWRRLSAVLSADLGVWERVEPPGEAEGDRCYTRRGKFFLVIRQTDGLKAYRADCAKDGVLLQKGIEGYFCPVCDASLGEPGRPGAGWRDLECRVAGDGALVRLPGG